MVKTWVEKLKVIKQNVGEIYKTALSGDVEKAYNNGVVAGVSNARINIYGTEIADRQFMNNQNLLVAVPDDTIEKIGKYAFAGCKNLYLVISMDKVNSIKSIKNHAFAECEKLRHVRLDSIEEIGNYAFKGCNGLLSFSLSDMLYNVSDSAFDDVEMPLEENNYGRYIPDQNGKPSVYIEGIDKGYEKLDLNDCSIIYKNAFKNFTSVKQVYISNVKAIGQSAFLNCNAIETMKLDFIGSDSETMVKNYDIKHGNWYFGYIFGAPIYTQHRAKVPVSLKDVTIKNGEVIRVSAFRMCSNIEKIILPETLKKIETNAFRDCNYLGSKIDETTGLRIYDNENPFTIPANVNEIQQFAFYRCNYLQKIQVAEENEHFKSVDGVVYTKDGTKLVAFPPGYFYDKARQNPTHTSTGYTMLDGVQEICDCAFNACRDISRITIGKDVTTIGWRVFEACVLLSRIVVAGGNEYFKSIDNVLYQVNSDALSLTVYPWAKVTSDKTYTVNANTSTIENFAFQTPNLTRIYIPKSVSAIWANAFTGCSSLKAIVLECSEGNAPEGSPWGAPSDVEIYYQSF